MNQSKVVRFSERVAGDGEGGLKVENLVGTTFHLVKWEKTVAFDAPAYACVINWNGSEYPIRVTQKALVNQLNDLSVAVKPGEIILVTITTKKNSRGQTYYTFADPDVSLDGEDAAF